VNPLNKWFEEYSCGCVSPVVDLKRDLTGYCPRHGNSRRGLFKNDIQVERKVESRPTIRRRGASDE
jgi:hypothetical protein